MSNPPPTSACRRRYPRIPALAVAASAVAIAFGGCVRPSRNWDVRDFTSSDRDATLLESIDAIVEWPERALDNLDRGIENAVY